MTWNRLKWILLAGILFGSFGLPVNKAEAAEPYCGHEKRVDGFYCHKVSRLGFPDKCELDSNGIIGTFPCTSDPNNCFTLGGVCSSDDGGRCSSRDPSNCPMISSDCSRSQCWINPDVEPTLPPGVTATPVPTDKPPPPETGLFVKGKVIACDESLANGVTVRFYKGYNENQLTMTSGDYWDSSNNNFRFDHFNKWCQEGWGEFRIGVPSNYAPINNQGGGCKEDIDASFDVENNSYWDCRTEDWNDTSLGDKSVGDGFDFKETNCNAPRAYLWSETSDMVYDEDRLIMSTTVDWDGDLTSMRIHSRSKPIGSAVWGEWNKYPDGTDRPFLADWSFSERGIFEVNATYTCIETELKDVQVVINGYDAKGHRCTGDPTIPPSWFDCYGNAEFPDHKEFVCGPSPTPTPIPSNTPTPTPTPLPTPTFGPLCSIDLVPDNVTLATWPAPWGGELDDSFVANANLTMSPVLPPGVRFDHVLFETSGWPLENLYAEDHGAPFSMWVEASASFAGVQTVYVTAIGWDGSDYIDDMCSDSITVTVVDPPDTCDLFLNPPEDDGAIWDPVLDNKTSFAATVANATGWVNQVKFTSSDLAIATLDPTIDDSGPLFSTEASGIGLGTITITAEAYINWMVACSDTSTFEVLPNSCDVAINPLTSSLELGTSRTYEAVVSNIVGTVDKVLFSVDDPNILSIPLGSEDDTWRYQVDVFGKNIGKGKLYADVLMEGSGAAVVCESKSNALINGEIIVGNPDAWWQVYDGDVTAGGVSGGTSGKIISDIPDLCMLDPICDAFLISDKSGYPGVPALGSTFSGAVSDAGWIAENSVFAGRTEYDYDFFKEKLEPIPKTDRNTIEAVGSVDVSQIRMGGQDYEGYAIYEYTGGSDPFTIKGDLILTEEAKKRRIVLFVDGSLILEGSIKVNKGNSFFMAIVSGDITIDPEVGGDTPDLEGLFYAQGQFKTGKRAKDVEGNGTDDPLHIRGSVVGYGHGGAVDGVRFQRDLPDNSILPAEVFEYAPDQVLLYPRFLSGRRYEWREVAP